MEKGYIITIWLLSHVFKAPQFLFIITGLFYTFSVCLFLYKNCENLVVGLTMFICLGLYTFFFQGIRQAIAMCICLFAIELCKKRMFFPFVLLVLIAFLFHRSSIVFLLVYFFYGKRLDSIWTILIIIINILFVIFSRMFVGFGNDLLNKGYTQTVNSGGFVALLIYIIIVGVAFAVGLKKNGNNHEYSFFLYMTVFGGVLYLSRYFGALILERVSFYFMFGQCVLLPASIKGDEEKVRVSVSVIIIFLCLTLLIYRLRNSEFVPYLFFWQ